MSRNQFLILICAGTLLYLFNSCDGKFEAITSGISSSSSQCKATSIETTAASLPPSPFKLKKLYLDQAINSQQAQKGTNDTQYLAILDNNCLRGDNAGELSKQMSLSGEIIEDWDQQPYLIPHSTYELAAQENEIESDPCIVGVSPNRRYKPTALSTYLNDPQLAQQSHLESINLEGALAEVLNPVYGIKIGSNSEFRPVVVAVLDTGVNYNHADLSNVIHRLPQGPGVEARTLGTENANYDGRDISSEGHGTHVAGLVAQQANNMVGGSGASGGIGVRVLPVNVFFLDAGDTVSDSATIIKGIAFAVQQGVSVINMSLGGRGTDPAVRAAIQAAIEAGVFVVVSAGNTGPNETAFQIGDTRPVFPAMYGDLPGIVTVGSTNTNNNQKSYFSLYSPTLVEISAPGTQTNLQGLYSTSLGQGYAYLMGTSMAAPLVAGAAALAQAYYRFHYKSDLTPVQLESALLDSATKNPGLATFFKDGNQLHMARLIQTLQARYPLLKGENGTFGGSDETCP